MPAAAVIPALIVYIKVVAVKKLVVELLAVVGVGFGHTNCGHPSANRMILHRFMRGVDILP